MDSGIAKDLSRVRAEVLDDEGDDDRRPVVRVFLPRQSDTSRPDVAHGRLRRWSGVGGRLRRPAENDVVVGGCFDDESSARRRLSRLAESLACVPAGVRLSQFYVIHSRQSVQSVVPDHGMDNS